MIWETVKAIRARAGEDATMFAISYSFDSSHAEIVLPGAILLLHNVFDTAGDSPGLVNVEIITLTTLSIAPMVLDFIVDIALLHSLHSLLLLIW